MTLLFMPMLAFLPTVIINYLAPLSVFFFAVVGVFINNNLCTDTPLLVFSSTAICDAFVIFTNGNNQTIFIKNYSIHD